MSEKSLRSLEPLGPYFNDPSIWKLIQKEYISMQGKRG